MASCFGLCCYTTQQKAMMRFYINTVGNAMIARLNNSTLRNIIFAALAADMRINYGGLTVEIR